MKYIFLVVNKNYGTYLAYDASEVTIEALQETFLGSEYHFEYLPISIVV